MIGIVVARNVNDAHRSGLRLLRDEGAEEDSRAGRVIVAPGPVVTTYRSPRERVLFDEARDANPFFHLAESVWMLAGRRDATWLDRFVRNFSSRFAEDDGVQHGAYGHRWRHHFRRDQLKTAADLLRQDRTTRQVVIGMWDPLVDLGTARRDRPCNTTVYFRPRPDMTLDMTVCCRSNDVVWGAYGANAVHMSVLHEWLAGEAGMEVGVYHQFSNNFHGYLETLRDPDPVPHDPYESGEVSPLGLWSPGLLKECDWFCDAVDGTMMLRHVLSPWLRDVVSPMVRAHAHWRRYGPNEATLRMVDEVAASDWRLAARRWIERRAAR